MGTREEIEAALAKAEAELAQAAVDRNKADADVRLEKARAHCRQERAALAELNRAEPVARSVERIGKSNRDLEKPSKRPAARSRETVRGFIGGLSARHPVLARQALMLLSLVLAYLQYYFFDVNLQVLHLPSIAVLLVG